MSIRKKFISYTSHISDLLPLGLLRYVTGQDFIIPFYHVVSDEECPHIKHLYLYKTIKQFEADIEYLSKEYQAIGASDLPDVISGRYKGKKIMLLTFDDGLRQMYDIVAPILLKKGIPAVFFLNTDFIDNKDLMFRYKASLATDMGRAKPSILKARNNEEIKRNISAEFMDEIESFLRDYKPYMTTDQIKSIVRQGFAIGAHSCSHPYYSGLSIPEQLSETMDSMSILKADFGIKEKLFAFPFTDDGVSNQFFDSIFEGNKIDFSFGGAGIKRDTHRRQFQRIPMEGWNASAEQILKSEYLYYLLRMPLGKNTIVRQ